LKANKLLNYIHPLKMKLDRKSLEIAYTSFIRPILEYGDVVWDCSKDNDHSLDKLEQINANAARLVCGATARCHLAPLYEENKCEYLSDRRKSHRLTVLYKMVYGLAPSYLANLLPNRTQERTGYNLRNKDNLDIPYCRLDCHKFSFLPSTLQDWNILDIKVKEAPSINSFKRALRKKKDKPPLSTILATEELVSCSAV
jgi:hypothetical protein